MHLSLTFSNSPHRVCLCMFTYVCMHIVVYTGTNRTNPIDPLYHCYKDIHVHLIITPPALLYVTEIKLCTSIKYLIRAPVTQISLWG